METPKDAILNMTEIDRLKAEVDELKSKYSSCKQDRDYWISQCEHSRGAVSMFTNKLAAEKAKIADLEKRLNFHIEFGERELLKVEQKSAKAIEWVKKLTAPDDDGFGRPIADEFTEPEVLEARIWLKEYEAK